jgi:hypothetical protein
MTPLSVKGHDGMPVEYEVAVATNLTCVDPSMQAQNALPCAAELKTEDFGVVEARHLTEPAHEVSAAGYCIID